MSDNNKINILLTVDEFISAQYLHQRRVRFVLVFIAVLGVILSVGSQFSSLISITWAVGLVIGGLIGLLMNSRFGTFGWRMRRLFRQQKSLQRPFVFSWDDHGTGANGEGVATQTAWADYLRWRENKELFMLYFSDVMFRLIPKRAFSSDGQIDEFRDLLRRKISPIEGRKRANG